jgi:hypothetical protein
MLDFARLVANSAIHSADIAATTALATSLGHLTVAAALVTEVLVLLTDDGNLLGARHGQAFLPIGFHRSLIVRNSKRPFLTAVNDDAQIPSIVNRLLLPNVKKVRSAPEGFPVLVLSRYLEIESSDNPR